MLFAEKMAGGADDDDTILKAFDAFEVNGKIEVDNAFGEFVIEDGMIDAVHLKGLMVSKKEEEAEMLILFSKYQSYHRHHLKIRISSCHKLQLRAKKTKKTNSSQFPSKLRELRKS